VEAISTQIEGVVEVDALECLQDNTAENSDTRGDAGILLRSVLTFSFLVFLPFWRSVLQSINTIQKRLQDPQMNFKDAADDVLGLKEVLSMRGEQFCTDALQEGIKKCNDWNVEMNHGTRRRKRMPGELDQVRRLRERDETNNEVGSGCHRFRYR